MENHKFEIPFGRENLIIETGKMAKQADGAITIQYGGTLVLVTAVVSKEPKSDENFMPLFVDYIEKTYAAGKIPGGFFKREGRPSEKEILSSRLIDRPIRPLFPEGFRNEVQVVATVLSHDGQNDPDVLAIVGASAALSISGIPFEGPIGALRVGRVDGKFIINPKYEEIEKGDIDLVVAGTKTGMIMLEAGTKEISDSDMLAAIEFGHDALLPLTGLQEKMKKEVGKPLIEAPLQEVPKELYDKVKKLSMSKLSEVLQLPQKEQREEGMDIIAKDLVSQIIVEGSPYSEQDVKDALVKVEKEEVRKVILDKKVRIDGRSYEQIRPITCEIGILPRTHGSGLFTRGQTQSLSVTTLGTSADEQLIDALSGETFKSFMLHYSFPPFSVGEVKPLRGPGRREIGHGALAERALRPVMPTKEEFPYTVRVVSEILESNGSSSMATVCAGTLALMDAGVPIKSPVSGIAMGLIKEGNRVAILTDISGLEDHFGDMDFKVTGTQKGITALQMDLKIDSIGKDIISQVLNAAEKARSIVLDKMSQTISKPKASLSAYAPRITTMKINTDKIRDVIGPGGKVIRKIIEDTGATIDIEDDGTVSIASIDEKATQKAVDIIKGLTEEPEVGKIYMGKITRVVSFGAFCEIMHGKEGLIHVSELADRFVKNVEDVVKVGDECLVKVIEIDEQGRINLSKKQAEQKPDKKES